MFGVARVWWCRVGWMVLSLGAAWCHADPPPGYYDTVDASSSAALRATLHAVIDDHQRFPYTSSATDTWDILEMAQENPADPGTIVDVYRNRVFIKVGGGNSFYNREHTWPNSYGFPDDGASNYPYTDCHQLFLCDDGYNSSRSNKPYRTCNGTCGENPTDLTNGVGGGTGVYPGNSNWTSGSFTQGTWETWIGRRGDVARALLYLDVRYEGGTHGITGAAEPDLILTDNEVLIAASNTGSNESVAHMGMLSDLLAWHDEDPVDDDERLRNDVIFSFQGNRNPFIDHPEWVDCLFRGICGTGCAEGPCDDGDACTTDDQCADGTCSGTAIVVLHGDQAAPWGTIDVDDLLAILGTFAAPDPCASLPSANLVPCEQPCEEGNIDVDDILSILRAFQGEYDCAHPCPP